MGLRILLTLPLVPIFLTTAVKFGRGERSILTEIEFSLLFVILTIVSIHITGLSKSPLYPLLYLAASVLAVAVDTKVSICAFLILVISDAASVYLFGGSGEIEINMFGRAFVSTLFFVFFLIYGRVELIRRREIWKRLKRFEEDIGGVKSEVFKEEGGITNESIEREALKTLATIDDTLYELLDGARSALSLNGVCYLIPDAESGGFRVREGSSLGCEFDFDAVLDEECFHTAVQTGRAILTRGKGGCGNIEPGYYTDSSKGVSVLAVVPVVEGGEVSGVLAFDGGFDEEVSNRRLSLFQLVAFMVKEVVGLKVNLSSLAMNLRELEELYTISRDLADAKKVGDVFNIVFSAAKKMFPVKTMVFTSKRNDESVVIASWGVKADKFKRMRFRNRDSLVGWVLENKKYLVFEGENKERNVFGEKNRVEKGSAFIIFPFISEEELIGTFVMILDSEQAPLRFYIRIMEVILNMTAVSMVGLRLMSRLNRLAITDPMTGLFNRRRFTQALREHWERAERYSENFSLLIIDIDFFKKINDTYGHSVGDEVIKGVSAIIQRTKRKVDIASRIGGEEFAVLLPSVSKESALATAERIRKTIKKDVMRIEKSRISVTVSIGIASYPGNWPSVEALMNSADNALYEAKDGGRDRSVSA